MIRKTDLDLKSALASAAAAACEAGDLMRRNWRKNKIVNATYAHDLKLDLDVRCQKLITQKLRRDFPGISILGEEGVTGNPEAADRWVVDPIDGTVNFAYGIPHACVSIALQRIAILSGGDVPTKRERKQTVHTGKGAAFEPEGAVTFRTVLGVVYDPFCDELWTAIEGKPAQLNGRTIQVSNRRKLAECVISLGFGKHDAALQKLLPDFQKLAYRVRKIRVMGAAALDLVYVASGRLDAYLESGVRLWDIAAGGFILERAGGEFWHRPIPRLDAFQIRAHNGHLGHILDRLH
jgi:myo-inositol-1(or 4)-monophosphatase